MNMRRKQGELIPLEVEILEAAVALQREGIPAFHGYSLAKGMITSTVPAVQVGPAPRVWLSHWWAMQSGT